MPCKNALTKFFIMALLLTFIFPIAGLAQSEVNWIEGPQPVDLGDDVAKINLEAGYLFTGGEETEFIMESLGNPPSGSEVGMIIPDDEDTNWFIVFEYEEVGYIDDSEKDEIDADALLESVSEGTEEANKIRAEQNIPPLHVIGWYEEPHYDETSHNLVWTLLAESEGEQVANYNVRLLGRHGYMSAVLVTDPETLDVYKSEIDDIIEIFSYKEGKSYAEYLPGDKVAEYGLVALVAGGAGAAAAKAGLFKTLAKFGKFIIFGIIAFFAVMWKKIKGLFGGGGKEDAPFNPTP